MLQNSFQNKTEKIRLINYRVYETKLAKLCSKLEKSGYAPVVIKGWAAAQFYPKPWNRIIGDVDLVFRPEVIGEDLEKMLCENADLPFDVHSGLRRLDTHSLEDLYKNSFYIDCCGTPVRVLRVEDHLRVLCVHWMNDGGANKDKLWDIFYAIDRNRNEFDWDRCLNTVSSGRKQWIQSIIHLAHIYLGLETDNLPFAGELKKNPVWLGRTVEKEWISKVKLKPLHLCLGDGQTFIRQIVKRIPPNPLQATVELEQDITGEVRFHYQFINILTRFYPSLHRIFGTKR